jgi:hypothetical protein
MKKFKLFNRISGALRTLLARDVRRGTARFTYPHGGRRAIAHKRQGGVRSSDRCANAKGFFNPINYCLSNLYF